MRLRSHQTVRSLFYFQKLNIIFHIVNEKFNFLIIIIFSVYQFIYFFIKNVDLDPKIKLTNNMQSRHLIETLLYFHPIFHFYYKRRLNK